jgi:vacuolar-type H+-ATPase subunit E/Vma4
MKAFLDQSLDGLTSVSTSSADLLSADYFSVEDIRHLLRDRAALVSAMRLAAEAGNLDRIDQLDKLYDELQELLDEIISAWPDDCLAADLEDEGLF